MPQLVCFGTSNETAPMVQIRPEDLVSGAAKLRTCFGVNLGS